MTPAARLEATIELWDKITAASIPMDNICGDYFRNRRFIGSKDRAEVAERVYGMMRAYARLTWWCNHLKLPDDARTRTLVYTVLNDGRTLADIDDLFNGRKYHPDDLNDDERNAVEKLDGQSLNHRRPNACNPYTVMILRRTCRR
jgi:16S rRNA (cytosine967-C5)-methyltransferase